MGVPALFRWLSKKYPKIVEAVIEAPPNRVEVDGGFEEIPIDTSSPNPNGVEFDHLYLDMNGIVHPCTHPEGKKAPETEEDMMIEVFKYTERVVAMVRPRKLLMIAIDGVAPRAKMNQQRSRRFRAAQEAKEKEEDKERIMLEWRAMGKEVSDDFKNEKAWDTNAITPGTPFMTLLANSLKYWIVYKLNTDPGWAKIQVVLSDASVPGEGEHKIMDFIRRSRVQPGYDPNTKHVIYGLDADLIMLSLATHEPHFKVLREDVFFQEKKGRGCHRCGQPGHHSSQCTGQAKEKQGEHDASGSKGVERKPFIFLDVATLREYLQVELDIPNTPFQFEFERAIDDWVLLIFFVGNDFLPHLPSLEIREGAIDTLLKIWKDQLPKMGGYLTEHGILNLQRAQIILEGLASREDEIFRRRKESEERQDRAEKRRRIERGEEVGGAEDENGNAAYVEVKAARPGLPPPPSSLPLKPAFLPTRPGASNAATTVSMMTNADIVRNRGIIRTANLSAAAMLKAELAGHFDSEVETSAQQASEVVEGADEPTTVLDDAIVEDVVNVTSGGTKRKADEAVSETATPTEAAAIDPSQTHDEDAEGEDEEVGDDAKETPLPLDGKPAKPPPMKLVGNNMVEQDDVVKLWEPGYRERYYRQKFGIELSDVEARTAIVQAYIEGLSWVLAYYYQGCPSWQWYYPYHYSPFAADFTNLESLKVEFKLGQPFHPYEQLMGVFPASSRFHIPETFHPLMLDVDSPIIDFYPENFEIDMNGKKMLWQGVALLPFIDEKRLLESMKSREDGMSQAERERNELGHDTIFMNEQHPQYEMVSLNYGKKKGSEPNPLDPAKAEGLFGFTLPDPNCVPGTTFESPIPNTGLTDIHNDRSILAHYYFPPQRTPHRSVLLAGVKYDKRVLTSADRESIKRGGAFQHNGQGFHQQRRDMGGPGTSRSNDYVRPPNGRPQYGGPPPSGQHYQGGHQQHQPPSHRPNGGGPSYGGYGGGYSNNNGYGGQDSGGYRSQYAPPRDYAPPGRDYGGYSDHGGRRGGGGGGGGYQEFRHDGASTHYGGYGGGGPSGYAPYVGGGYGGYRPPPVVPAYARPAQGGYSGYTPPGGGRGGYSSQGRRGGYN